MGRSIHWVIYIAFTLFITEWRMVVRRTMNDLESKANTRAIDSLLNYETVKYFGNAAYFSGIKLAGKCATNSINRPCPRPCASPHT